MGQESALKPPTLVEKGSAYKKAVASLMRASSKSLKKPIHSMIVIAISDEGYSVGREIDFEKINPMQLMQLPNDLTPVVTEISLVSMVKHLSKKQAKAKAKRQVRA